MMLDESTYLPHLPQFAFNIALQLILAGQPNKTFLNAGTLGCHMTLLGSRRRRCLAAGRTPKDSEGLKGLPKGLLRRT